MKIMVFFIGIIFSFLSIGCDEESSAIDTMLTDQELMDLLFLREEEKLARDVYIYSYDIYNMNISWNISQSEQRHMDAVLSILMAYNVSDPASDERGVFNNAELQTLYDQLVLKVDSSKLDALIVGAMIEDLDIQDLVEFKSNTQKSDLISMYDNLACGSRNHLRSYYKQIQKEGADYNPLYISESKFQEIINGSNGPCGSN